jgi:hypothetical protein
MLTEPAAWTGPASRSPPPCGGAAYPRQTGPASARRAGYPPGHHGGRASPATPAGNRSGPDPARNAGGRALPGPPHSPATARRVAAQAQCPHVRALCAAIPARSPLLPALTRSLRAASAFLTSLPHKAETVRSGTLHLYYTSKQTGGETNPETHWGTRNPPGPKKHGPVPGSPDPSSLPKDNDRPRRTHHRGKRVDPGTGHTHDRGKGDGEPRCARHTRIPARTSRRGNRRAPRGRRLPRRACRPRKPASIAGDIRGIAPRHAASKSRSKSRSKPSPVQEQQKARVRPGCGTGAAKGTG